VSLIERIARVLLAGFDEALAIGVRRRATYEQMNVVRHDAVRKQFELALSGRAQDLRSDEPTTSLSVNAGCRWSAQNVRK
jgi:hypothetical protein